MNRLFFRALTLALLALPCLAADSSRLLDDFASLDGWTAASSQGATARLRPVPGPEGGALALDFDLSRAYGHAIARRDLALELPDNYEFTFDLRADSGVNNFEVKLIDEHDNVWWIKRLSMSFPAEWTPQYLRKRHFSYAWGPQRTPEIRRVKAIEFVVSSVTGGKGTLFISNLRFTPVDDAAVLVARARVETNHGTRPETGADQVSVKDWRVAAGTDSLVSLTLDFGCVRELGGLVLDWTGAGAGDYEVHISTDGTRWRRVAAITGGNGGRDWLHLPELRVRHLRLIVAVAAARAGFELASLAVRGPDFGASENAFFEAVARDHPRGLFPRYLLGEQLYWTVAGSPGHRVEALLSETGAIEVDQSAFTIEPFLLLDGKLLTWADVELSQSLEKNYLPIPSVTWRHSDLMLTTTALVAGTAQADSRLFARYEVRNHGRSPMRVMLFLAVRPFQVNPPWQSIFRPAGWSRTERVGLVEGNLCVDGRTIVPLDRPDAFGASAFAAGEITEHLQRGAVPATTEAFDAQGFASGALAYAIELQPGEARAVHLLTPLGAATVLPASHQPAAAVARLYASAHDATRAMWEAMLDRVEIRLPASAQPVIDTIKSNLAYIFINQDGPRIQPGSRNYQRSWIRDGSLTSTALLQLGLNDEVKAFADWYARFQFPNGKVPCVVDELGADPTDEHDSHGQLIYLIMQVYRFTRDEAWLRGHWDTVRRTVGFIKELRASRQTPEFRDGPPAKRVFYGLVPESISHEGYSAQPMHSYWDNFFVLRGLKDAVEMARVLSEKEAEAAFAAERDDCACDLYASIELAMKNTGADFIPGCAELGDFDATSTTIALTPVEEIGRLPGSALQRTFDRYFERFEARRDGRMEWLDFTPYENRVIGTFVQLGHKDRAHAALDYFMAQRRPAAWNHWAEVVFRDPRLPRMIGDMPHTWCGSDFMRSVRMMFVHERESDQTLVVAPGLSDAWVMDPAGIEVVSLPTYYGNLSYTVKSTRDPAGAVESVAVAIADGLRMPPGGFVLASPLSRPIRAVSGDGCLTDKNEIRIDTLPAKLSIAY
jgi:hypothetical protein